MTDTIPLQPLDALEIQVIVDNQVDLLLRGGPLVSRAGLLHGGPRVETPLMLDPSMPVALVAEHGFSALVTATIAGRERRLLFDAGLSTGGVAHNLDVLQRPLADIEAIVMSHGHFDHVSGLHGLVARLGARRLPMLLHPDFWLRRRVTLPHSTHAELPTPSRAAMEGAGFDVVEGRRHSLLIDGRILITGEVDRTTTFEHGMPAHEAHRHGRWEPDPLLLDDQALIAHVAGKGLVVLTGCGHAGIVNIVRHAQRVTGETKVHAIIGGFHLNGPAYATALQPTVDALAAFAPALISPGHCTGDEATRALSLALPDAFVPIAVGTRFTL
ncbi:MAG: MBL fold metallo-hydrolase [Chloroflexi bacterium]|nr:MBL fold metallo-hydrolase [Chloroflexota bacterium]